MDNLRNTESDGFFYEELFLILMIQFNSLNPTDHGKSIDKPIRTRVIMTPLMLLPLTQTSLLWVTCIAHTTACYYTVGNNRGYITRVFDRNCQSN
ncbi:MAG TPA: hypothetical protein DIT99_14720 [Candidatus Latescibacteria bacterium]|nr:hypothetical protein [Candidatus Latescibacterota bacterium]